MSQSVDDRREKKWQMGSAGTRQYRQTMKGKANQDSRPDVSGGGWYSEEIGLGKRRTGCFPIMEKELLEGVGRLKNAPYAARFH